MTQEQREILRAQLEQLSKEDLIALAAGLKEKQEEFEAGMLEERTRIMEAFLHPAQSTKPAEEEDGEEYVVDKDPYFLRLKNKYANK